MAMLPLQADGSRTQTASCPPTFSSTSKERGHFPGSVEKLSLPHLCAGCSPSRNGLCACRDACSEESTWPVAGEIPRSQMTGAFRGQILRRHLPRACCVQASMCTRCELPTQALETTVALGPRWTNLWLHREAGRAGIVCADEKTEGQREKQLAQVTVRGHQGQGPARE